jgi:hypothetical protein
MLWNIIIGLVFMVAGYMLMPRPKVQRPEITEMEGPTAEAGKPIPVLFGDDIITSPNYLWWGEKNYIERVDGGTGKKKK